MEIKYYTTKRFSFIWPIYLLCFLLGGCSNLGYRYGMGTKMEVDEGYSSSMEVDDENSHCLDDLIQQLFEAIEKSNSDRVFLADLIRKLFEAIEEDNLNNRFQDDLSQKLFKAIEEGNLNNRFQDDLSQKLFKAIEEGNLNNHFQDDLSQKLFKAIEEGNLNNHFHADLSQKLFKAIEKSNSDRVFLDSLYGKFYGNIKQDNLFHADLIQKLFEAIKENDLSRRFHADLSQKFFEAIKENDLSRRFHTDLIQKLFEAIKEKESDLNSCLLDDLIEKLFEAIKEKESDLNSVSHADLIQKLFEAIKESDLSSVNKLLAIDFQDKDILELCKTDTDGNTCLHIAAGINHKMAAKIMEVLLDKMKPLLLNGIDRKSLDEAKMNSFVQGSVFWNVDRVKKCIKNLKNKNFHKSVMLYKNKLQETPALIAVKRGSEGVQELLLEDTHGHVGLNFDKHKDKNGDDLFDIVLQDKDGFKMSNVLDFVDQTPTHEKHMRFFWSECKCKQGIELIGKNNKKVIQVFKLVRGKKVKQVKQLFSAMHNVLKPDNYLKVFMKSCPSGPRGVTILHAVLDTYLTEKEKEDKEVVAYLIKSLYDVVLGQDLFKEEDREMAVHLIDVLYNRVLGKVFSKKEDRKIVRPLIDRLYHLAGFSQDSNSFPPHRVRKLLAMVKMQEGATNSSNVSVLT